MAKKPKPLVSIHSRPNNYNSIKEKYKARALEVAR